MGMRAARYLFAALGAALLLVLVLGEAGGAAPLAQAEVDARTSRTAA